MAFVAEAALIALREGLEAFLIAGILIGLVVKLGRPDARVWVWGGFAAGAGASLVVGLLVQLFLLDTFEANGGGAWFELVAALTAVGVLTYMVFWMWKHTRTLMGSLRQKVDHALASNTLWVIAFLTFVSVLREGLEVVLFYAALSTNNAGLDLAWSGLIGVAASVGLVWVILRTTVSFNLAKFFGATGILLVFVAGGLLVHSVTAATEVGLLSPQPAIWDTSAALTDDSAVGRVLHALLGYTAAPSLLQALLYFGYLFGVGVTYLWSLGTYHDRSQGTFRRVPAVATVAIILFAGVATAWGGANPTSTIAGADHEHANAMAAGLPHESFILDLAQRMQTYEGKVGILIRDHGEMVEYNASTYESIKQFIRDIWPYTGLPAEALDADEGTFFLDEAHPFATQPQTDPRLVDAWTNPWELPAAPAGDYANQGVLDDFCTHQPQFYFVPGPAGPGWGEGDLLEIMGLCTYRDWLKMENHSPRYEQGLFGWEYLAAHLVGHFGDKIALAFAHGVDPKVNALETLDNAAQTLVDAGATVVLDVYQSSIFSDAMNTCMMAPHAEHALRAAGYKGKILSVGSAGTHALWGQAVAEYVGEILADVPTDEKVAVHLVQHGGAPDSPNPCGGGDDQYHANAATQYQIGEAALKAAFADRPDLIVRQVYGQGADAADDGVLSPTEALSRDRADGAKRAIMIPYEFWGDAVDNLVYFRESLGFTPEESPYYSDGYRTELDWQGLPVLVPSAEFSTYTKCDALLAQIAVVLDGLAPAPEADR